MSAQSKRKGERIKITQTCARADFAVVATDSTQRPPRTQRQRPSKAKAEAVEVNVVAMVQLPSYVSFAVQRLCFYVTGHVLAKQAAASAWEGGTAAANTTIRINTRIAGSSWCDELIWSRLLPLPCIPAMLLHLYKSQSSSPASCAYSSSVPIPSSASCPVAPSSS